MRINHTCLCDSMCDDTRDGLVDATWDHMTFDMCSDTHTYSFSCKDKQCDNEHTLINNTYIIHLWHQYIYVNMVCIKYTNNTCIYSQRRPIGRNFPFRKLSRFVQVRFSPKTAICTILKKTWNNRILAAFSSGFCVFSWKPFDKWTLSRKEFIHNCKKNMLPKCHRCNLLIAVGSPNSLIIFF